VLEQLITKAGRDGIECSFYWGKPHREKSGTWFSWMEKDLDDNPSPDPDQSFSPWLIAARKIF
jgi:hypothetical protein